MGQTAGPILTRSQNARVNAYPLGLKQRYHNFRGQNPSPPQKKPPKIGPKRHFPAKMPKSYNGNISKTVTPIKLKVEA